MNPVVLDQIVRQQEEIASLDEQNNELADRIEELERELRETEIRLHDVATLCATVEQERDTAWAQAHRLALELECLLMDTKDNAVVSKWWDSAFEAIEEYNKLMPGAAENAEAWAKIRKAGISARSRENSIWK